MSRTTSDWPSTPRRRENTGGSNSSASVSRNHHHRPSQSSSGILAKHQQIDEGRKESITYKLEWRIEDVLELAMHVEGVEGGSEESRQGQVEREESPSEVLRAGRSTVDGMYKLDLGVTTEGEGEEERSSCPSRRLSIFICCVALDVPPFTTDLFVGIIGTSQESGREYGSTPYLWSHSQPYTFRLHDNFVKIPLPVLSELAKVPSISDHNAFTICISICETYGRSPAFQPAGEVRVPTDLISALGSMIDVPAGSDVRFVCLEHRLEEAEGSRRGSAESDGMYTSRLVSRKRVLYANSQVLAGRSTYFADLFKGDFAEAVLSQTERYKTVLVESADFDTVYWMLRFVYTNELLFDEKEDRVRDLLRQQSIDSATIHRLTAFPTSSTLRSGGWSWHSHHSRDDESSVDYDDHSMASSVHSSTLSAGTTHSLRSPTVSSVAKASSPSPRTKSALPGPPKSATSRSSSGSSYPSSRTIGKGPHPTRSVAAEPEPDPHAHPCVPPPPACALAVYMLAHQYRLTSLEGLAQRHILSHLTHSTCISVFLASYRYPELHERVLDYIHAEWKHVKHDAEFVRCFQEVARGVWGEEGGTILADMVARLPY